jgi:hypothetical protein
MVKSTATSQNGTCRQPRAIHISALYVRSAEPKAALVGQCECDANPRGTDEWVGWVPQCVLKATLSDIGNSFKLLAISALSKGVRHASLVFESGLARRSFSETSWHYRF